MKWAASKQIKCQNIYQSSAYGVDSLNSLTKFLSFFKANWATFDSLPIFPQSYVLIEPEISIFFFFNYFQLNPNEKCIEMYADKSSSIRKKVVNESESRLNVTVVFDSTHYVRFCSKLIRNVHREFRLNFKF